MIGIMVILALIVNMFVGALVWSTMDLRYNGALLEWARENPFGSVGFALVVQCWPLGAGMVAWDWYRSRT